MRTATQFFHCFRTMSLDFQCHQKNGQTVFIVFAGVLGFPMQPIEWRLPRFLLLHDIFNHITNKSPVNGYFLCCCMNVDSLGQPFPLRGRGSSLGCLDLISNKTHTNVSANPKLHRLPRDTSWNKFLRQSVGVGCRHAMANATKNLCVLMTPCKHFPTLQQCYEI